jgi:hypothetical protein
MNNFWLGVIAMKGRFPLGTKVRIVNTPYVSSRLYGASGKVIDHRTDEVGVCLEGFGMSVHWFMPSELFVI